jgi:pentatricopeptide repeat protein
MLAEARISVLLACSHLPVDADHRLGREAHAFALRIGFLNHGRERFPFNALLSMYARLGLVDHAQTLFCTEQVGNARRVFGMVPEPGRQLGMWNAMICGYAQAGMDDDALQLFARMEAKPRYHSFLPRAELERKRFGRGGAELRVRQRRWSSLCSST